MRGCAPDSPCKKVSILFKQHVHVSLVCSPLGLSQSPPLGYSQLAILNQIVALEDSPNNLRAVAHLGTEELSMLDVVVTASK
jgi:hypothetical protein